MKVEVIEGKKKASIKYPCLMASTSEATEGLVVLFSGEETGTVVNQGKSNDQVGMNYDGWAMDTFEKFNGKLLMSNDD